MLLVSILTLNCGLSLNLEFKLEFSPLNLTKTVFLKVVSNHIMVLEIGGKFSLLMKLW